MPDNNNLNEQNENTNAYSYNPNRPAPSNSPVNPEDEHADTKKVVDTVAKGAAEYFAPGVGGQVYDMAKKVPGVGEQIDQAVGQVAQSVDQIPGAKKLSKGLNESGATDAANQAISLVGSKGASGGAAAGATGTASTANPAQGTSLSGNTHAGVPSVTGNRKNAQFNQMVREGEGLPDPSFDAANSSDGEDDEDTAQTSVPSDLPEDSLEDSSLDSQDKKEQGQSDLVGQAFGMLWQKYKIPIILGGAGVFFFLILILIIFGGGADELNPTMGYYDALCNYNDTHVTLVSCSDEGSVIGSYQLEDFVLQMTYSFVKDGEYSDETIKALMVILKTNALSLGNYNSSDKNVEVRVCDFLSDEESFVSTENLDNLSSLYQEISNYLYISSSYHSTISNLSRQNVLSFGEDDLDEMESLALEGNTYSQILNTLYNTSSGEDSEVVYRETLFLGDSRTRGMQNAGLINSGNTIYGIGYGYSWLTGNGSFSSDSTNAVDGGVQGINALMRDQASYNIVIWLGVNDLGSVNNYYQAYYSLASNTWSNHNIYIVSVGPVIDELSSSVTNEAIDDFNLEMSSLIAGSGLNNLFYIDLGYNEDMIISASDGIHYSNEDYENIYEIIMNNLDSTLSSSYQLYNLTSYCTYYTVTQNDAYWWPIGSSEATEGNIYGGDPVSVNITSTFGPRYVFGEYDPGHGAIDIGTGEGTPVIATKSGTITFTNEGCSVGDHSCGGGYGNYIKMEHGDGIESLYAHLRQVLVSEGDTVVQGQIIGYSGNTGRSTGPHLHFEIRLNGTKVDPLEYVDPENPRPVQSYILADVDDTGSSAEENKAAVCTALLNSGFSENAVAGMMVNIAAEGGFRTNNLENCYEENQCCTVNGKNYGYCVHTEIAGFGSDTLYTNGVDSGAYSRESFVNDHAGYGLIQWTSSGRKAGLYDYAKSQNKSIAALSVQLGYLLQELQYDSYALTYKYITGNYSAYDIANTFCQDFESPSNESTVCPARARDNVDEYLTYVQNGCSE